MKHSIPILVAAIVLGAMSERASVGQGFIKGDEVIALRVAPLRVEAKTGAMVGKGDKFVVEEVQGDWVWLRRGETLGWIEAASILGAKLLAWYKRQPDVASRSGDDPDRSRADEDGQSRANPARDIRD